MTTFGYIASLAMGVVLGLMGGGGSILTVPIMVYLFGLPPTAATGYSLFIVGMAALFGGILYVRRGEVAVKTGLIFAIPSIAGVQISRALILPRLPVVVATLDGFALTKEILIMVAFATMMIAASYSMIRSRRPASTGPRKRSHVIFFSLQGLVVGMIAGFVGAGGGFLIVPALVILAGLPMRIAVGTSLMIIALQSLAGFAGDLSRGIEVDWLLLGTATGAAALGIALGSAVSHRVKEQKLKSAFGWFVLLMGSAILAEQAFRLAVK